MAQHQLLWRIKGGSVSLRASDCLLLPCSLACVVKDVEQPFPVCKNQASSGFPYTLINVYTLYLFS